MKMRSVYKGFRLIKQYLKRFISSSGKQFFRNIFHRCPIFSLKFSSPIILRTPGFHSTDARNIDTLRVISNVGQFFFHGFIRDPVERRKVHTWIASLIRPILPQNLTVSCVNLRNTHNLSVRNSNADTGRITANIWDWFIFSVPILCLNPGVFKRSRKVIQLIDHRQSPLFGYSRTPW